MKNPKRITVAVDEETLEIISEIKEEEDVSRSELVRKALRYYHESRKFREYGTDKLSTYLEMLSKGEHVVLDVDHWLLLLDILKSSPREEEFWQKSKQVANSHADQLSSKIDTVEDLLKRLEACNFFNLNKISENEFTLIVNSEKSKQFIKRLVKDFSDSMGFDVQIQEDIGKLRLKEI